MSKKKKAADANRGPQELYRTEQRNRSGGRQEVKDCGRTDRNAGQRAPSWPEPPGADAARLLARLLGWGAR